MTPKEKARELFDKFYDPIEDVDIKCGTFCLGGRIENQHLLAKKMVFICLEVMKTTRRKSEDFDYSFWDEVEKEVIAM